MRRATSIHVLTRFLPLDLLFGVLVPFAHFRLLELEPTPTILGIEVLGGAARMALWIWAVFATLAPADEWEATPRPSRTDALVTRAVHTVQGAPMRIATLYTAAWISQFLLQCFAMRAWVPGALDQTAIVATVIFLLAIVPGAYTFNEPLVTLFLTRAHVAVVRDAQERNADIPRAGATLGARIGVLALGIALGPALWMTAVGYRTEVNASVERSQFTAMRESTRIAEAARHGALSAATSHEGAVVGVTDAGAHHVLASSGEQGALVALLPSLRTALAGTPSEGVVMLDERVLAYERIDGERVAVALLPHRSGASFAFIVTVVLFVLVILAWAPISAVATSWSIAKPIERVAAASARLVEVGTLSDMETLPVIGGDEIAQLTERFNTLVSLLRRLSNTAREVAEGDLTVEFDGRGDLPAAFRGMIQNLREIVRSIRENANLLGAAAAEIYAATREQEAGAAAQSSAVHEIGQTMESLASSAAHVAEAVQGVRANAEQTLQTTDRVVERIGELTARASRIHEILQIIRDVADRTDLLALNGSLEATRVGEAGRGFALLASEMRRLAERVAAAVNDVRKLLDDIRESGASTAIATEEGRRLADDTANAARSIALVTQQQRTGTEQVSESVRGMVEVVAQGAAATTQSRTAAEELKKQADRLNALVERFQVREGNA